MKDNFSKLISQVKEFLANEPSGHDFSHAQRVFKMALYLQSFEGGDEEVIGAAALVHDICRPFEKKTGKSHFGPEALAIIKEVLIKAEFSAVKIEKVLAVVELHDIYDWTEKLATKSLELKIVQDADNLDAIGAIGIGRTFAFGGANGLAMYRSGEDLTFTNDFVEDPEHRTTTIAHFYEKLLKLKDNMNTETGKKIAFKRHQIMLDFLAEFFKEWNSDFKNILSKD